MAKISAEYKDPIIELSITPDFIKQYDLYLLLNNSSFFESFLISGSQKDSFGYPFLFPPKKLNYDNHFLKEFLRLFQTLISQYDLTSHEDHLLFLANTYYEGTINKRKEELKSKVFKQRGKLLYNLIKAPFPIYNIDTIHEAFSEEDLTEHGSDSLLKTYLHIITQMPLSHFENRNGKLNKKKIPKEVEMELMERILADTNISVKMENGRNLIISESLLSEYKFNNQYNMSPRSGLTH